MVRRHRHAVLGLHHAHGGGGGEQLRHHAVMRRVQMLDQDEGHGGCRGQSRQKAAARFQPAGGRADADDAKTWSRRR